jgi:hypothetical protein
MWLHLCLLSRSIANLEFGQQDKPRGSIDRKPININNIDPFAIDRGIFQKFRPAQRSRIKICFLVKLSGKVNKNEVGFMNNVNRNSNQHIFSDLEDIVRLDENKIEWGVQHIQQEVLRPGQENTLTLAVDAPKEFKKRKLEEVRLNEQTHTVEQTNIESDGKKRKLSLTEQAENADDATEIIEIAQAVKVSKTAETIFGEKINKIEKLFSELSDLALAKYASELSKERVTIKNIVGLKKEDKDILGQIRAIMCERKKRSKARNKIKLTYSKIFASFKMGEKISEAKKKLSIDGEQSDSMVTVADKSRESIEPHFNNLSDYALANYGHLLKVEGKTGHYDTIADARLKQKERKTLKKIRKIMGVKKTHSLKRNRIQMTYAQIGEPFDLDKRISQARVNVMRGGVPIL